VIVGRHLVVMIVVIAGVVTAAQQGAPVAPQFRTTSDLVTVDVSVRDGNGSLEGLTAADFVLLDNGVRQNVERLDPTSLAVDVSLLVDVSGRTRGFWDRDPPRSYDRDIEEKTARLAASLRPTDRIRVLTIDSRVSEVLGWQAATAPRVFRHAPSGGLASVHDALIAAMLEPSSPDRRHFVVALTPEIDTLSQMSMVSVREVARRSDAVLHVVQEDDSLLKEDALGEAVPQLPPSQDFWLVSRRRTVLTGPDGTDMRLILELQTPVRETAEPGGPVRLPHRLDVLKEAAAATGGAYHGAGFFASRDVVDTFREIFDDFRRGYVLRYAPQGVTRDGWHEIKVTVPSRPGLVITARRGYAIEPPRPAPPVSSPRASATPAAATVESLAALYERGAYGELTTAIRASRNRAALLRRFRESAHPVPGGRREAVFALEIVAAAMIGRDRETEEEMGRLLSKYTALVRHPIEPDRFECAWHWTAAALLEGIITPDFGAPFVARALERCPGEGRLVLAKAILADQRWPVGLSGVPDVERLAEDPKPGHVAEVQSLYERAAGFADVAAEARVRQAWLAYRIGRPADAVAAVDGLARLNPDKSVRYLGELVRGHALKASGRMNDAATAYRAALELWPGAQSARIALMTLLASQNELSEAESLAESVQTAPADQFDPWWMYWQGDYRAYGSIAEWLRELAR